MRRDIAVIAGITLLVLVIVFGVGPWLSRTSPAADTREGRIIRHAPDTTPQETPARPEPAVSVRVLDGRNGQRLESGASVILEDAAGGFVDTARGSVDGREIEFGPEVRNWPLRVVVRHAGYRQARPAQIDAPGMVDVTLEPLHAVTLLANGPWRYVYVERATDDASDALNLWAVWYNDGTVLELPPGRYNALLTKEQKPPVQRLIKEACATASFEVTDTAATFRLVLEVPRGKHTVHGTLHDKAGLQLTGMKVYAVRLGPGSLRRVVASAFVGDRGDFRLTGLPDGTYRIQPDDAMDAHGRGAFAHVSVPHDEEVALVFEDLAVPLADIAVRDGELIAGVMPYSDFWQPGASIYVARPDGAAVLYRHWDSPATRYWKHHFTVPLLPDNFTAVVATVAGGRRAVACAIINRRDADGRWRYLVSETPEAGAAVRVRGLKVGTPVKLYGWLGGFHVLLARGKADGEGLWAVDRLPPGSLELSVQAEGYESSAWFTAPEAGSEHEVVLTRSGKPEQPDRPEGGIVIRLPNPPIPPVVTPYSPEDPHRKFKGLAPPPHPIDLAAGPVRQLEIVIAGDGHAAAQQALLHAYATEWVMTAAVDEAQRTPQRFMVRLDAYGGRAILTVSNLSQDATSLTLQIPGHEDVVINLTDSDRYEVSID